VIEVRGLSKTFGASALLDGLDLDVAAGELVAIVGESGAGKSTLLNLLAALDRPDGGRIRIDGVEVSALDDDAAARWRRAGAGFVFQAFHLLPYLDVEQNVALPLLLNRVATGERRERSRAALESVGIAALATRSVASLSGGEAQRVAIARAIVHRPRVVLADEPTGNLDEANARQALAVLRDAVKREGAAGVLVTHSRIAAQSADRALLLKGGRLAALAGA
jgi:putative ABC transport system ATP-binding protein